MDREIPEKRIRENILIHLRRRWTQAKLFGLLIHKRNNFQRLFTGQYWYPYLRPKLHGTQRAIRNPHGIGLDWKSLKCHHLRYFKHRLNFSGKIDWVALQKPWSRVLLRQIDSHPILWHHYFTHWAYTKDCGGFRPSSWKSSNWKNNWAGIQEPCPQNQFRLLSHHTQHGVERKR